VTAPPPPVVAAAPDAAEPGAPTTTLTATPEQPEQPAARFPRSVIARPLTLPSGLAMLGADAVANHDFSAMGGAPIVGYGFTDDFEVQVPYSFAARDFEARGSVAIDAGYKLLRGAAGGKLEAIARVRGGYDTLGEVATPLMLGVHVQYNVTDTLALISGYAGTQQIRIALSEDDAMATPADLSLPIAVGYQATPELYLQVDTKLAQFDLHDSANAFIGADMTPVSLTAVYNVINALDVQAAIGTDLTNSPGDSLSFLVGARYYAGTL
ncbi:MAG TPA: hypothetical protein VFS15_19880, partial [Kofleriaceae bacterium]|nr:hypothetical protein [Kofleriaceae bacterium]